MFNPARLPDTTCRCGPSIAAVLTAAAGGALFIICLSCAGSMNFVLFAPSPIASGSAHAPGRL